MSMSLRSPKGGRGQRRRKEEEEEAAIVEGGGEKNGASKREGGSRGGVRERKESESDSFDIPQAELLPTPSLKVCDCSEHCSSPLPFLTQK